MTGTKDAQQARGATSGKALNVDGRAQIARAIAVLTGIAASALIAACGGGGADFAQTAPQSAMAQQIAEKPLAGHQDGNPFSQSPVANGTASKVLRAPALAVNAAPAASPYGEASVEDAANQLLDFAEKNYGQFFPSKVATQVFWKYTYRHYPERGTYVGVATNVAAGDNLVEGGVYVMGGPFGEAPTYVGVLNQFITPFKVAHYTDKVYAIWTGSQIYSVSRNADKTFTVAKVKNVSQYQFGFYPLFNCGMYTKSPLPNGNNLDQLHGGNRYGAQVLCDRPLEART